MNQHPTAVAANQRGTGALLGAMPTGGGASQTAGEQRKTNASSYGWWG